DEDLAEEFLARPERFEVVHEAERKHAEVSQEDGGMEQDAGALFGAGDESEGGDDQEPNREGESAEAGNGDRVGVVQVRRAIQFLLALSRGEHQGDGNQDGYQSDASRYEREPDHAREWRARAIPGSGLAAV